MSLVESVLAGEPLALARLLSQVENASRAGRQALDELFPQTGKAHFIGVTGATGTGKSSLVNRLALHYRKPRDGKPRRVAIVAVDPSSPFTGGAVLGDRVRMADLSGDSGVFIRSMASRGSLGGLARTTAAMAQVFDAAGFDLVIIETVGAGQSEVEIARLAHTTLVVESPGLGDDIQAIKAGILEIADIIVVNKADLPGADKTERSLKNMLGLAHSVRKEFLHRGAMGLGPGNAQKSDPAASPSGPADDWEVPVLPTVALDGTGVSELALAIDRHAAYLRASGEWDRRERTRLGFELESMISEILSGQFHSRVGEERFEQAIEDLVERRLSPGEAAQALLQE